MNPIFDKAGKLALICAISALLLGIINSMTEPVIATRKAKELKEALASLVDEGTPGEKESIGDAVISARYPVEGAGGYILDLVGKGYGGDLKILASYKADGTVLNVVLMDNAETPGLGKKAENHEYMTKYIGHGGSDEVPTTKDQLENPDAVSGATITFAGIGNAIATGSDYIKSLGDK